MIVDAAAFGAYALLWFITFVYIASEWGEVSSTERDYVDDLGGNTDTIQAAIAFSFFCILIWVSLCVCARVHAYPHLYYVSSIVCCVPQPTL